MLTEYLTNLQGSTPNYADTMQNCNTRIDNLNILAGSVVEINATVQDVYSIDGVCYANCIFDGPGKVVFDAASKDSLKLNFWELCKKGTQAKYCQGGTNSTLCREHMGYVDQHLLAVVSGGVNQKLCNGFKTAEFCADKGLTP